MIYFKDIFTAMGQGIDNVIAWHMAQALPVQWTLYGIYIVILLFSLMRRLR